MKRRTFIGALGALPFAARAQPAKMPVIGYLSSATEHSAPALRAGFLKGLGESGFVVDRNLAIEYRWAANQVELLPALAASLIERDVSVIFASAIRASLAAKAATTTIPIVFATANDPVQFGLVSSFNRPSGNLTGVTWLSAALGEKRLDLLRKMVPTAKAVGVIVNPANANADANVANVRLAALALGLQFILAPAASEHDFEPVVSTLARQGVSCVLVLNDPLFLDRRKDLIAALAQHVLPAIYPSRESIEGGGLMSYGASISEAHRQAGVYAGRILRGARPADLPVTQPTIFELVINMGTARALRLEVPPTLLAIADEVIE